MSTYDPVKLAAALAQVLETAGIGQLTEGAGDPPTLFINRVPDQPDQLLAIFNTGGFPDNQSYDSRSPLPTIQLRSRSQTQRQGASLLANAHAQLLSLYNVLLDPDGDPIRVLQVETLSPPGYIGEDEKGRREFTSNLALTLGRLGI